MLSDLSLTPFLLLAQVGAWVWIVRSARLRAGITDEVERDAVALACLMLIWAAGLSAAALAGLLRSPMVAGLRPELWLGLVPYALVALSMAVLPGLRSYSLRLLDRTPIWLLPLLQALRLVGLWALWPHYARLGAEDLGRALLAEPLPFALAGLDLLYGASALVVALLVAKSWMGPRALFAWLTIGALLLLVPRLGIMNQSLGLAFSLFYLPLDPQGLLGYPHVLNYGLIGPAFVLMAFWQGLWVLRRSLVAPLTIASADRSADTSAAQSGPTTGGRRAPNLGALIAPLQALAESLGGQSPERKAELRADRRAKARERVEARQQAQAEKAAKLAAEQAERQAQRMAQKEQEREAKMAAKQEAKAAREAQRAQKPITAASPVTEFGAPPALPGQSAEPQTSFGGLDDQDFDTSPFQIEPLPERAWSKAHDLNAEPDIPFEDPLVPTNVAPLPSEVPPPAPPPLDPVFSSLSPGVNPDAGLGAGASEHPDDSDKGLPPLRPKG